MSQSQPLRIESSDYASFGTSRTINSQLWFVNSPALETRILGYLAKYKEKYEVKCYAFVFSGSHDHLMAQFTKQNRAPFYRDFNARKAEAVRAVVPNFPGGPLFQGRYREQAVPLPEDIEDRFFYCALQPIQAGLCQRLSEYPGYNSFYDAICGIKRKFKVVDWAAYNATKRYKPNVKVSDFTTTYRLSYDRLPGYEHLSQKDYRLLMLRKLEARRIKIINELKAAGHRFLTQKELRAVTPGTPAKNPKRSNRHDFRPLVLTCCKIAKQNFLNWYFSIYEQYKTAAKNYFAGNMTYPFPPGTFRPPMLLHEAAM